MLQDPLDGWLAESIRLSFLDIPGWTQRPIFGEVAGVEPTSTSVERMVQTQQEAGDVSHAFLNVMQQSNRIDIVLGDKPSQNTVDPLTPGYKPFSSGLSDKPWRCSTRSPTKPSIWFPALFVSPMRSRLFDRRRTPKKRFAPCID